MGEEKESLLRVHTYAELAHQRETSGHPYNQPQPESGEKPIINARELFAKTSGRFW